jgi:rhombotail lipoprotein
MMLFHATGRHSDAGKSTPVDAGKVLREASEAGFEAATDDLIAKLGLALDEFAKQAASGTIRGEGTPAVAMVDRQGRPVQLGGGGAGALGLGELALGALLLLPMLAGRRRARRGA